MELRTHARWSTCALAIAIIGCDSPRGPTTPPSVESLLPIRSSAQAFAAASDSDSQALQRILASTASKARRDADHLFGRKGTRTHDGLCSGIRALLTEAVRELEKEQHRLRTAESRQQFIDVGLIGAKCGQSQAYSIFRRSLEPIAPPASKATSDFVDDNLTANGFSAMVAYAGFVGDNGVTGDRNLFTSGLTPLESQVFDMHANQVDAELIFYGNLETEGGGGGAGPDPYSIFSQAGRVRWFRIIAAGCAGAVISQTSTIISSARIGFYLWGPSGAAIAAGATAVESCAVGAFGAWLMNEMAK